MILSLSRGGFIFGRRNPMRFLNLLKNIIKTSWQIFLRDMGRIVRTPVAILVLLGIAFMPSLYAWFNISAYGDPYAQTGDLRVAVANNDQGAYDDAVGNVNAGESLVDVLKENDDFGWFFTSEDDAVAGVRSGDYYAAIVVPEDFSADLIGLVQDPGDRPTLQYYVNEKINAIAPLMAGIGIDTIQSRINHECTAIAADAVGKYIENELGTEGSKVENLYAEIISDLDDITANINAYHDNVESFKKLTNESGAELRRIGKNLDSVTAAADSATSSLQQGSKTIAAGNDSFAALAAALEEEFAATDAILYQLQTATGEDLGAAVGKFRKTDSRLEGILSTLQTINTLNGNIINDLQQIQNAFPTDDGASLIAKLKNENQRHQEILNALKESGKSLDATADSLVGAEADIAALLKSSGDRFRATKKGLDSNFRSAMTKSMSEVSAAVGTLSGLMEPVDGQVQQIKGLLTTLSTDLDNLEKILADTETALDDIAKRIDGIAADLAVLKGYAEYNELKAVVDDGKIADFISSPITVKTTAFYRMKDYGSAMAPFFTSLAIWVGGIMMLAVFKLEVAKDQKIRTYRTVEGYFGRWLLFIIIGQGQALVVGIGDLVLMGIQCVHPLLFIAACCLSSFVFVNIMYALAVAFRHVGKALCVILLIFQIPGSSGTYPVEMASGLFRALYPVLPFTYSVNAMREAIAGVFGHHFAMDMLILSSFLLLALVVGVVLRPLFLNLNALFDRRLGDTDLMITEENSSFHHRTRMMFALKILAGREGLREQTKQRLESFNSDYNKRMRRVFRFILLGLPLLLLILLFISGSKMLVLVLWIISLVILTLFLVLCEYIHDNYEDRKKLAEISDEELLALLREEERGEDGIE